jgi:hypothetical protein
MALPRLIKACFDLVFGIIKGVIYVLSIGYWNLFKEDELKIKKR